MISKEDLKNILNQWCLDHNYKYEHLGFLDRGFTVYGIIETKRKARYWIRLFSTKKGYNEYLIQIVRSNKNTYYSNPNSIKALINGQITKGKILDSWKINRDLKRIDINV